MLVQGSNMPASHFLKSRTIEESCDLKPKRKPASASVLRVVCDGVGRFVCFCDVFLNFMKMDGNNNESFLGKLIYDLSIDAKFVKAIEKNKALLLVHQDWLHQVELARALPSHYPTFELSDEECKLLLSAKCTSSLPHSWKLVLLTAIPKHRGKVFRLLNKQHISKQSTRNLTFSQLIHYVSETNYKNLWKNTYNKYHQQSPTEKNKSRKNELQSYNSAIRETINRIYGCPIILTSKREDGDDEAKISEMLKILGHCHPNILPAYFALESLENFYLLQPFYEHTLYDCVQLSPAALNLSTGRCLFVFYQLLHCLSRLLDLGLHLGNISLGDIYIDQEIWIQVTPRIWEDALKEAEDIEIKRKAECREKTNQETRKNSEDSSKTKLLNDYLSLWVQGEMSNFDYLMELNKLAGREMGNPKHHPVIPWIVDFASPDGGWRDLTKSKYRLTKGDRQLDLTYESSSNNKNSFSGQPYTPISSSLAIQVPHHFSEVLSDITYYVYKARRIPKSVLCKHVRTNWVPAEYPSSMQRLQVWTPDECIPEFFTDPEIFKSVHEDLNDLELPNWCSGPSDFIRKHMALLESDHVSERLHHWIDLTFGYKLSGSSAVKSKNVCLPLVDQHTTLNGSGMTQLFAQPHPHKMATCIFAGRKAPKTFRSVSQKCILQSVKIKENSEEKDTEAKDTGEDDTDIGGTPTSKSDKTDGGLKNLKRSKSMLVTSSSTLDPGSKAENRPENQVIVLPKDYNPLAALQQVESLYNFASQTIGSGCLQTESFNADKENLNAHRLYKSWDMLTLGCLLSQISLPSRFHVVPKHVPLKDSYNLVLKVLQAHSYELPKYASKAIQLLLQIKIPIVGDVKVDDLPSYPPITPEGLPPISSHQLLQPLINLIPFSPYYDQLYNFICRLNKFDKELRFADRLTFPDEEKLNLLHEIADEKVSYASQMLPRIFPHLDSEGVDLLIPFLLHMFDDRWTSLLAVWHLFEPISRALGVQAASVKLVPTLTKLLDPEIPSAKHLKLYHRSCLLQWIVRLGLQTFLSHFVTLIIEATGGVRDFSTGGSSLDNRDVTDTVRKSSHLTSDLDTVMESDVGPNPEDNISPYEDTSVQSTLQTSVSPLRGKPSETLSASSTSRDRFLDQNQEEEVHASEPEIFDFESAEEDSIPTKNVSDGSRMSSVDVLGNSSTSTLIDQNEHSSDSEENENKPMNDIEHNGDVSFDIPDIGQFASWSDKMSDKTAEAFKFSNNGSMTQRRSPNGNDDVAYNISDVAAESVLWLAHRLGPVLTAKHLSRNLLKMLTLCYLGPNPKKSIEGTLAPGSMKVSLTGKWVVGDNNAAKVLECLGNIVELYGENFIISQFFPHASDLVNLCKKHINDNSESALIGMLSLMQFIIPYLSDALLMDNLEDLIIKDILYPATQLATSLRFNYFGGSLVRSVVASKLVNNLYIIGLRIGFEMTRKHLSGILTRFFSAFDKAHESLAQQLKNENSLHSTPESRDDYLEIKKSSLNDEYVVAGATIKIKECEIIYSPSPRPNSMSKMRTTQQPLDEIIEVFNSELAYFSYIPFCKLAGGIYMEQTLKNDQLLRSLCFSYEQSAESKIKLHSGSPSKDSNSARFTDDSEKSAAIVAESIAIKKKKGKEECLVSGEFGKNVAVVGNRIDVAFLEEVQPSALITDVIPSSVEFKHYPASSCDASVLNRKMENNHRHLKGNWRAYWENEIGSSDKKFNFKQIKLQSFVGHTGSVRSIHVLDNENSFITGSRDKSVKLWSLRSSGDGSSSAQTPCQWTYNQHRKSVFSVAFLDSLRLVASSDSNVHIWDPFIGSCIKQYESPKHNPAVLITAIPSPSPYFIVGTSNSNIKFLDPRSSNYAHEFKGTLGTPGLIRCVSVSPDSNWIAIGYSSGIISVLDLRTGLLLGSKNCHEGEILQVKAFNRSCFVSSSLDQSASVWYAEDIKLKCHLRGILEPVTCLNFYKGEVITGTTANKIGVHSSIDNHVRSTFTSTKLMSDTFKGVLTSMAILPLNRLLILGADNGNLSLLC